MKRVGVIICLFILAISSQWSLFSGAPEDDSTTAISGRMLVRIELETPDSFTALRDMNLDLASLNLKRGAHVIVTPDELREIERRGFSYEILIDDPSKIQIDPEYRDYEETVAYLDSLNQEYADLTVIEQVGVSQEFEIPVWGMKISDNPQIEEDEPEILFTGVTHAREPLGNEICLGIARTLLEGYGVDPDLTALVDAEEIWIIPIVNTEGFKYMMDNDLSDPWWRKNQRDNNNNGVFDYDFDGVDLNRNYDFNWASGGSSDPASWVYRGPAPFSESETQAIRDFSTGLHRFVFSISYHSYGEDVFWPWNWPGNPAPDEDVISEVAMEMASRITTRNGFGTYDHSPIGGMTGYSTNWLYAGAGSIDFTVETCTEFIPAGTAIDSIVEANIPGALYLLERALVGPGITGHVTDSGTGLPIEAEVRVIKRDTEIIEPRTCEPTHGRYLRMLPPGVYVVWYTLAGYGEHFEQVAVESDTLTVVDVELSMVVSLGLSLAELDDDATGPSDGNGDGFLNPGETVELDVWLENIGMMTAYSVSCTLSTADTLVTLIDSVASYGDIQPEEILPGDSPFVFTLSEQARDEDEISFRLIAADTSSNSWSFDLDFTVYAAEIDFQSKAIDDSEGGDGDGVAEAGETIDLLLALRNRGSLAVSGVWADISTGDPFISILADSAYFGDMDIGEYSLSQPPYTLSISPDVQDTHTVRLTLGIHGVDYEEEEEFSINLSPVGIDAFDEEVSMPRVTRLYQNYPNPFNPSTKIEFDIAGGEGSRVPVKLSVYSSRGKLVKGLLESSLAPGRHRVIWDGKDSSGIQASSGIYILKFETPNLSSSLKMVIQK
ncbi:MAG: M14 family zinc carboxypeptidase [Candidatus Glassbacteria bacterium]